MTRDAPARIVVEQDGARTRIRELTASTYLRPRLLGSGAGPRVALVAACASLLAGDHLRLEVEVGAGAALELVEPSGTVAYDARGGRADWTASVRVEAGGSLVWGAAPFVVAHGADVHRHTGIDLEPGAAVLLRETFVLGRSNECGGALRSTLTAVRDRRPLQAEDLDLTDPVLRGSPAVLGTRRVLATATLLGIRPDELADPHETALDGPGALRRELADHAHLAEDALEPTWARWRRLVGQTRPARTVTCRTAA
ncbi:urease accessory protein [Pseudonocardia ammonioxydans]|uniref:Urease accessory protein UreD n=1 Tax=Pseudonocardia ammonioxydans TaxID=260086 RepID=A0A1I4XGK0_PSUAM|nr:urease accessory protein UreD [Pseudonocardia ammonioxydans]SFN25027.1 urease accessory protein [Pseudonocardia ammonioxydans]